MSQAIKEMQIKTKGYFSIALTDFIKNEKKEYSMLTRVLIAVRTIN